MIEVMMKKGSVSCSSLVWRFGGKRLGEALMIGIINGSAGVQFGGSGAFVCMRFAFILLRLMKLRFREL